MRAIRAFKPSLDRVSISNNVYEEGGGGHPALFI